VAFPPPLREILDRQPRDHQQRHDHVVRPSCEDHCEVAVTRLEAVTPQLGALFI
jgi:proline racemase